MALTEIPLELSSTPSIVDNGNATAITIDSSENVGVGVAPIGTGLNIKANGNGYTDGALSLTDTDSDTRTYLTHVNNTFAVSMNDGAGDGITMSSAGAVTIANGLTLTDGNVVVANGHGIDFSATSGSGTSELLDDYEEGAWTPTIFGGSTAGTYSLESARTGGIYTKIGNMVTITAVLRITSIDSAGGGTLNFGGLPFGFGPNLSSSWGQNGGIHVEHYGAGTNSSASTYPPPFIGFGGGVGAATFTAQSYGKNYEVESVIGDLSANYWIYIISGTYQTAT